MTELNLYRFILLASLVTAAVLGIRKYGDYRVEQVFAQQMQQLAAVAPAPPHGATVQAQWSGPVSAIAGVADRTADVTLPGPAGAVPPVPGRAQSIAEARPSQFAGWRPPENAVASGDSQSPPVDAAADSTLAQIRRIQQQLNRGSVADRLSGDGQNAGVNAEAVFAETIRQLQAAESQASATTNTGVSDAGGQGDERVSVPGDATVPAVAGSPLTAHERRSIETHLRWMASQLESRDPARSQSCQRLARRLAEMGGDDDRQSTLPR
jgi:hypothetical protein